MDVQGGRGPEAVADMKARIAAGWTVDQLIERFRDPNGIVYDYLDLPNTQVVSEEEVA